MMDPRDYFTIVIPWVEACFATPWHPTEKHGAFSTLTRGVFPTEHDAILWAKRELNGTPYQIARIGE